MSAPHRRPLSNSTNSASRNSMNETTSPKPPGASTLPSWPGEGLTGPPVRHSRTPRKLAGWSGSNYATEGSLGEDEAKATNAQLVADLRDQVQRAEAASDQYQRQLEILQMRMDELSTEHTAAEEKEQQRDQEFEGIQAELKESVRQRKALEKAHEAETSILLQDRKERENREMELRSVIHRLNDTIKQGAHERMNTIPDTTPSAQNPTSNFHIRHADELEEKEHLIDALRLELVESQIKLTEMENLGDGRFRELEKALIETKMANARLIEDNESFQLLLSEKTLKGDFMNDFRSPEGAAGLSSLAEELESAGAEDLDGLNEPSNKIEAEIKTLREANRALTLYIDRIIGRLLDKGYEHIMYDKAEAAPEPPVKAAAAVEKALPPPPPVADVPTPSLLQRARSVVSRPTAAKVRPQSYMQSPAQIALTANENPDTAPSIPLSRGHRRSRSDQVQAQADLAGAAVVQQMTRGSPLRVVSGGPMGGGPLSPHLHPQRPSYFQAGVSSTAPSVSQATTASGPSSGPDGKDSSANSLASDQSGSKDSPEAELAQTASQGINIPGAVMKQNQLRPLQLVRQQQVLNEDEGFKSRAANRSSWMGWFKGATVEAQTE